MLNDACREFSKENQFLRIKETRVFTFAGIDSIHVKFKDGDYCQIYTCVIENVSL